MLGANGVLLSSAWAGWIGRSPTARRPSSWVRKTARAWFDRNATYLEQEQLDKALADRPKVIELDPRDARAWVNRRIGRSGAEAVPSLHRVAPNIP
jgi:hypothetical protein